MISNMPLILSLETATLGGSVWLGRGTSELASRNGDPQISQSNSLLRDINDCLSQAGVSLDEVDVFACAAGPGSFTGLRIGIATLKGLAATLGKPCVGIPSLAAVAHAAGPSDKTVALLPAGRGEVFAQLFSVSVDGNDLVVEEIDKAGHLSPAKMIERYRTIANLRWAGNGAHSQRDAIIQGAEAHHIAFSETNATGATSLPNGWSLATTDEELARHVAALAAQAAKIGNLPSAESLRAIYVRPSDAELKELQG